MSVALVALLAVGPAARSQTSDFSGLWKQDDERCEPRRNGNVTLHIEHHDPELEVETTISRSSHPPRHAEQDYTTDGKVSISTGADGDEFHTSVIWKDSNLIFSIEEHEDGRVLRSTETWSLVESGTALQRIRVQPDGDKQTLFYRRQQTARAGRNQP